MRQAVPAVTETLCQNGKFYCQYCHFDNKTVSFPLKLDASRKQQIIELMSPHSEYVEREI